MIRQSRIKIIQALLRDNLIQLQVASGRNLSHVTRKFRDKVDLGAMDAQPGLLPSLPPSLPLTFPPLYFYRVTSGG